jgi:hypothetical protein
VCNACGFACCAWDGFGGCGCDHCDNPECWEYCEDCGEEMSSCLCNEDDDFDYDEDDRETEGQVLDCGLEGCLMPGYHFRHECHTAEMIEAMYEEHERESSPPSIPGESQ